MPLKYGCVGVRASLGGGEAWVAETAGAAGPVVEARHQQVL